MPSKEEVIERIKNVFDPHIGVDIYSLGLIYDVKVENANVIVNMTLTNPGCPMAKSIIGDVKNSVEKLDGVDKVEVNLVFDPPWKPTMMSDDLKKKWNIPN